MTQSSRQSLKPDQKILSEHLSRIAVPRDIFQNRESLGQIENYIIEQFMQYGYTLSLDPFQFQGQELHNIIAGARENANRPKLLIGAHFDAVPGTPGADDNASGVAAMLEAARLLSLSGIPPAVEFVAFNAEEYGMVGSAHYARQLKASGAELAGMISLEMVAYTSSVKGSQKLPLVLKPFYPDTGDFLALVANPKSAPFLKMAEEIFRKVDNLPVEALTVPWSGRLLPATRLSDHSPFWDEGFPALLVTDTSFFRNPHYHTADDKVTTLNIDFLARVSEGTFLLAKKFAQGI